VEEARLGAEHLAEVLERSGEAGGTHDVFHLGPDAGDLVEPGLEDGIGREVEGGVLADQHLVPGAAVGKLGPSDVLPAGR